MKLLIIRHAIAMDRVEFHQQNSDDSLRPLTDEGRKKMRRNALGLKRLVPELLVLASSPLVRAQQTATIVADVYAEEGAIAQPIETCDAMKPDMNPEELLVWLREKFEAQFDDLDDAVIAVIGHEPHLSQLLNFFVSGEKEPLIEMRKGGACLLTFEHELEAGRGQLEWLLKPSVMRKLAKT